MAYLLISAEAKEDPTIFANWSPFVETKYFDYPGSDVKFINGTACKLLLVLYAIKLR